MGPVKTIDFGISAMQIDGTPFKDPNGRPVQATWSTIIAAHLGAVYADEAKLPWQEKFKRGHIIKKLADGATEWDLEETDLIKDVIGRYAGPNVVFPLYNLIEAK